MSFFGLDGFWNDFTGKTAANDIKKGTEAANSYLKQGYDESSGIRKDYANQAIDYYKPRIQSGQDAEKMYRDATGLNGPEAQKAYYANFQYEPGLEAELAAGIKATDQSAASRGMLRSGRNANAIADTGRRWANTTYNNRLGQYAQMFTRGDQASDRAAATTSDLGNSLSDMRSGLGQQYAGNVVNQQNAIANTRNMGLQNTLNVLGTVSKFFTPNSSQNSYTSFGQGQSQSGQGQGYNYFGGPR